MKVSAYQAANLCSAAVLFERYQFRIQQDIKTADRLNREKGKVGPHRLIGGGISRNRAVATDDEELLHCSVALCRLGFQQMVHVPSSRHLHNSGKSQLFMGFSENPL